MDTNYAQKNNIQPKNKKRVKNVLATSSTVFYLQNLSCDNTKTVGLQILYMLIISLTTYCQLVNLTEMQQKHLNL